MPHHYPDRNILGVIVPTLEEAVDHGHDVLGIIGTHYIVHSNIYLEELKKIAPNVQIFQKATPLLVPLIEHDGLVWAEDILRSYLEPLIINDIECLILGCTHYPFLKPVLKKIMRQDMCLLSQDDFIPRKLIDYLNRHPEYAEKMSYTGKESFFVTDLTDNYKKTAKSIYGEDISVQSIRI